MSFRATYILFGILVVELVAFGLNQVFSSRPGDELYVLPELHRANSRTVATKGGGPLDGISKEINQVEIDQGKDGKIVFTREAGKDATPWKMTEPFASAIESDDAVRMIIDQLVNARKEDKVEMKGKNLDNTGLKSPKVKVTITKTDGQKWTLNLGERQATGGRDLIYVNSSDLPKEVLAMRQSNLDGFFKTYTLPVLDEHGNKIKRKDPTGEMKEVTRNEIRYKTANDFRSRDLVTPSNMMLQQVDLKHDGHEIKLKRENELTRWKFEQPKYGPVEYDPIAPAGAVAGPPPVASMKQLLSSLEGLKVAYEPDDPDKKANDFVAENVSEAKLAEYGLSKDKPFMRIGFERTQGGLLGSDADKSGIRKDALLIGNELPVEKGAEKPPEKEPKDKDPKDKDPKDKDPKDKDPKDKPPEKPAPERWRYARLESENNVVKIPVKNIENLVKITDDPSSLRNHDLALLDRPKVDAIDIKKTGGATLKFRKVDGTWKLWDTTDKGVAMDDKLVNNLLSDLVPNTSDSNRTRMVKSFPKDDAKDADLGLDEKDRSGEITLWENGLDEEAIKKEEKKDVEPKMKETPGKVVKFVFGKALPDKVLHVLREADKQSMRLTVEAGLIDRLNDNRLDYIDKTLPTFNARADITKIVIHQNGKDKDDIELVLEKKDDKPIWVLKKPDLLAGRTADRGKVDTQIIDTLATLRTDKFFIEKLTDAKDQEKFTKALEHDGLKPAEVQVTVTVKKNDKENDEYIFQFGKAIDKDEKRYARIETKPETLAKRDVIFEVQPEAVKKLVEVKLLDPTVTDYIPTKVTKVKLVGWRKLYDGDKTLEVEREGTEPGKWKVLVAPEADKEKFDFDGLKMEFFLPRLAHLKAADEFLEYKFKDQTLLNKYDLGKVKKDDKEEEQFALQITLTFAEDQKKEPLVLTIGKYLEDKKGYAATSSTLPGDIFVLPKAALPTFKDKDGKELDIVEGGWKYFSNK